jgi:threonine dehydrogenase-like Zn-dependent dehydrogenase
MKNVKAVAVFPKTEEVKLIKRSEPRIAEPTQVRLRMLDVGICGMDEEICRFEYGGISDSFIVHWPKGIKTKSDKEVRQ